MVESYHERDSATLVVHEADRYVTMPGLTGAHDSPAGHALQACG